MEVRKGRSSHGAHGKAAEVEYCRGLLGWDDCCRRVAAASAALADLSLANR